MRFSKLLASYYQAYPAAFDRISRRIGYRVRPSFAGGYQKSGHVGLIAGFDNDGIAGVPAHVSSATRKASEA